MRQMLWRSGVLFFSLLFSIAYSQPNYHQQDRCKEEDIPHYTAYKITKPLQIDGIPDEAEWQDANRSTRFADLISGAEAYLDTRAAVLWDDQNLYVAYWLEEPDITATLTQRDAPIYKNNDAELFIAGKDGYYEFEINSFGTIYEVLFFWLDAYEAKGYSGMPEFKRDVAGARIFNGVGYRHPRGKRIGFWNWDMPGLRAAVHVNGTINNNTDKDKEWTVEIAIPWSSLKILAEADGRTLPPSQNDEWRMDFSRFNIKKYTAADSGGWAWSPHGVWDSHVPECFPYIVFSEEKPAK